MATNDFFPVRMSTLKGNLQVSFDLFIFLNDKYIHYIRQGDVFEKARYDKLREKKLKKLFIKEDQEKLYRSFLDETLAQMLDPNHPAPPSQKAELVHGRQQANAEEVMENTTDENAYQFAKVNMQNYLNFINSNNESLRHILNMQNEDKTIGHHCAQVATWAALLGSELKIHEDKIPLLTMGALLHDMGHLEFEHDFFKKEEEFSPEEMKDYVQHPFKGADKVKTLNHFEQDVIQIILQHEEMADGSGYPKKLAEKQINELALIVSCANTFDKLVSIQGHAPKAAAKEMLVKYIGKYPLSYLQGLQKVVNQNA